MVEEVKNDDAFCYGCTTKHRKFICVLFPLREGRCKQKACIFKKYRRLNFKSSVSIKHVKKFCIAFKADRFCRLNAFTGSER